MTDCKGAFAFGYERRHRRRTGCVRAVRARRDQEQAKPSAGMTGIQVGGTPIKIVGYGCGNDTVPVAVDGDAAADGAAEGRRHGRPAVG